MARIEKQKLISDVLLQLTQGAPSQDIETEDSQIAYWLSMECNFLVAADVNRAVKQNLQIPQLYIVSETCKQLTEKTTPCVPQGDDGKYQRFWFALTKEVVDAEDDRGIVQVLTQENEEIKQVSTFLLPMFSEMRYTRPTTEVLSWSRQGDLIYIQGFKESDEEFNTISVFYVPKQDIEAMSDTDTVVIADTLLPMLLANVVQKAKQQLYGSQADTENNSIQDETPVYSRQIAGEPQQQQPQ